MAATLDLSSFKEAIASLESGLGTVSNAEWFKQQSPAVQNTLVAGVIQNFEFVYEIGIKMIRSRALNWTRRVLRRLISASSGIYCGRRQRRG